MGRETYAATVRNTEDPDKRGRIKVSCPGIMGDDEQVMPMWIRPLHNWGWFSVPDVGEVIEIELTNGVEDDESLGQSSINAPDYRWNGNRHWGNSAANEEEQRPVPEDFTTTNYGKRRGFATPGGHVFLFDDTKKAQKISISWADGIGSDAKRAFLSFENGSVILAGAPGETGNQTVIYFNTKDGQTSLIDEHGNVFSMSEDEVSIVQKDSNIISLTAAGQINILAQAACVINAPNVHLNAGEVLLGDGLAASIVEPVLLGLQFAALYNAHVHPVAGVVAGPAAVVSGPPAVPMTPNVFSTKVKSG